MGANPLISVIMSVNRDDGNLTETINSILNQTYKNYELIIINDGGSKDVRHTIKNYNNSRLKYYEKPKIGLTACLNYGVDKAKGEYIARQDAGDISLKNRFKTQINFFNNHPEISLIGSWVSELTEEGDHLGDIEFSKSYENIKENIPFQNAFCHGTIMALTTLFRDFNGYRDVFLKAQDYDLWLRIIEKYKVVNIGKVLYKRIVSRESITIRTKKIQMEYADVARKCFNARLLGKEEPLHLLKKIKFNENQINFSYQKIDSDYYFYCGRILFSNRKMNRSRIYFIRSIYHNPFKIIIIPYLVFSFLPTAILDMLEKGWKCIQFKLKIQI